MTVLEQIQGAATQRGMAFLLIGGFAVIEHGYARLTNDLDLLVCREEAAAWRELLLGLRYRLDHDGGNFQQYSPPEPGAMPVDLMLVAPRTFDGMLAAARPIEVQGASVRLVSLDHLLALKLHALKQARLHRFLQDFQDVLELVRVNKLDLRSPRFRDLFLRYGTADLYDKFLRMAQA
jgi:predicted nucleotidyltransferase